MGPPPVPAEPAKPGRQLEPDTDPGQVGQRFRHLDRVPVSGAVIVALDLHAVRDQLVGRSVVEAGLRPPAEGPAAHPEAL